MTGNPRIALVTSSAIPDLTPSDRVLAAALHARGLSAEPAVWTDQAVRWGEYDLVIVRSPWDYFLRIGEFLDWIDRLDAAGDVKLANGAAVLRWNTHKRYLRELAERGAPLPPSLWLDHGTVPDLNRDAEQRGWARLVVKPAVSGGAHDTWVTDAPLGPAQQERVAAMLARGDVLVQPFIEAVPRDGEMSFVFLEGRFSHAVRKRAAAGDFRVQTEHGGSVARETVGDAQVRAAAAVLALAPEPTLYARVDAIVSEAEFLIMELELVEPDLFLDYAPEAAGVLAEAIERRVLTGGLAGGRVGGL